MDQIKCDVLIVGSGAAGLMCLAELDPELNVLVVSKNDLNRGSTNYAQGGVACVMDKDDSVESHIEDTLYAGGGLCNEEKVSYMVKKGPAAMLKLAESVDFDLDDESNFILGKEGAHKHRRILHCDGDATGRAIQRGLIKKVSTRSNTRLLSDYRVIELLCEKKTCHGALLWDHKRQVFTQVQASIVVLATGGYSYIFQETTNPWKSSGDGIALALRSGAEVSDMEFTQFHPTALFIAGAPRFLISEAVRGEGAILRNIHGEAFMKDFHPMKDLAPRDVVSRAITQEMIKTKQGCVFLDLSHLPLEKTIHRFPNISTTCQKFGVDISKQWIPVRPAAHYTMGGVKVDSEGKTSVQNLFACGEVACTGVHGANRLASNSLLEAIVFGTSVAQKINKIKLTVPKNIKPKQLRFKESNFNLSDIIRTVQSLMWRNVGVFRNKENLEKTYKRLQVWNKLDVSSMSHIEESMDYKNIIEVSLLVCKSALLREESRGGHYRTDYIEKNDKDFLHSISLNYSDIKE